MQLDNSNPLFWFISFLNYIRVEVLEKFTIPGLGVSYWTFSIGVAVVAVVMTVLINSIRRGSSNEDDNASEQTEDVNNGSVVRSHYQNGGTKSVETGKTYSGGRSTPKLGASAPKTVSEQKFDILMQGKHHSQR